MGQLSQSASPAKEAPIAAGRTGPSTDLTGLTVDTDGDSAIGGDLEQIRSSITSIQSSVYDGVEENGRTYHKYKEGSYLLPNDETEQNRLDLQHHLCKLTLRGKSHLAPIQDPKYVLDFGTGTGIWAIEFAEEFPSADVLGTDLSPIQPDYIPLNCRFEVDDAEDDWVYSHKFDYVHGRLLCVCFKDPAAVFQKAFHSLNPGGYFEMFDFNAKFECIDNSADGTSFQKFSDLMLEGAKMLGRDFTHAPRYKEYFEKVGFVDVVEERFQWPFNTWPKGKHYKTLGRWYNEDLQQGLSGMAMATLTRAHKMTPGEVEELLVDVQRDINNKNIHTYLPLYVVYGRKPE